MRLKEWFKNKNNVHYLVYILCVSIWYLINFFRVNGSGGQWALANEFIWLTIFFMFAMRLGIRSFFKLPYALCLIVSIAVFYPIYTNFAPTNDYKFQFIARYINAWICLVVLLRLFFYFYKDRQRRVTYKFTVCFVIWVLLLISCIASKNESPWPLSTLVFIGGFCIIPMNKEEINALVNGVVDGIIINFFVYQGLALLHRPYETEWLKYCSFFSNSDCSAKFFTVSYVGFLMKYLILRNKEAKKWRRGVSLLFASSMWGFIFFTMSRSGYLGVAFTTLVFFIILSLVYKEKIIKSICTLLTLALFATASIPIIFVAIRYIPALRHHPIFIGAYSQERVHSWDPIDSDKYATWEDVISAYDGLFWVEGEYNDSHITHIKSVREKYLSEEEKEELNGGVKKRDSIAIIKTLADDGERVIEYDDGIKPGTDENHPIFISFSYNNYFESIMGIRKYLYAGYLLNSGLMGNKQEYVSLDIGDGLVYSSAHNSALDFMSRYGFIAGVIFEVLQVAVFIWGLKKIRKNNKNIDMGVVLATLMASAYFAWGIFYSVVFFGEILDTLFWFCAIFVMKEEVNEEKYGYSQNYSGCVHQPI